MIERTIQQRLALASTHLQFSTRRRFSNSCAFKQCPGMRVWRRRRAVERRRRSVNGHERRQARMRGGEQGAGQVHANMYARPEIKHEFIGDGRGC